MTNKVPDNASFIRYLVTPRGKSTSLIIAFLVVFILNAIVFSLLFGALSSFGTNGVQRQFLDVLNVLARFVLCMILSGLCVYYLREIYNEYLESKG